MTFGQSAYTWLSTELGYVVLIALIIGAVYFALKRETAKMIGFIVIAVFVVFVVFNTTGFKNLLLAIITKVFGV